MPFPSVLSAIAVTPDARCSYFWYQFRGMAATPYRSLTLSGPVHMESRMASG